MEALRQAIAQRLAPVARRNPDLAFAEAAERLLLGRKLFPLLLPRQDTVPYYGETLRRGDPRILPLGGL